MTLREFFVVFIIGMTIGGFAGYEYQRSELILAAVESLGKVQTASNANCVPIADPDAALNAIPTIHADKQPLKVRP